MNSQLEQDLRRRLGIPADARHVLVLAEISHWDPDWLFTSDEYYDRWVCRNLNLALDELMRDPCRIYSVECLFFLRKYWDAHPGYGGWSHGSHLVGGEVVGVPRGSVT